MSWTGALLIAIGLFCILRTVRPDSSGNTLVNYILGTAKHG